MSILSTTDICMQSLFGLNHANNHEGLCIFFVIGCYGWTKTPSWEDSQVYGSQKASCKSKQTGTPKETAEEKSDCMHRFGVLLSMTHSFFVFCEEETTFSLEGIKENVSLPSSSWTLQCSRDSVSFVKLSEESTSNQALTITHTLRIASNQSWILSVNGHTLTDECCSELFGLSTNKVSSIKWNLQIVDQPLCQRFAFVQSMFSTHPLKRGLSSGCVSLLNLARVADL